MIESGCEARFLPSRRSVAGIAPLLEFAFVRILVTIGAACKRQPCVARLPVGAGRMAALAQDRSMGTGQWIARLRVIEVLPVNARSLPIDS